MGAYENQLKVTLTNVNAPILVALGSLIPGVGTASGKIIEAVRFGVTTEGKGVLRDGRLIFNAAPWSSLVVGVQTSLDIPLSQVTGLYRGSAYLGGHAFTIRHGGTAIDMIAISGGKAFVDQLELEIRKAGGRV